MKKSGSDFDQTHPRKRAESMRAQAMAQAQKRKEEFLGARVPMELRAKVIQRAEQEGLPVSLLIRRILENYVAGVALTSSSTAPNVAAPVAPVKQFAHVLAWDKITLNKDVSCTHCGAALEAGASAMLGLNPGHAPEILCERCKGAI